MSEVTAAPTDARQRTLEHLHKLFYAESELGLCGCGNPEDVWELIADVLKLAPFYERPDAVRVLIRPPGAYHMVLSALTNAGLIEHGSSIGGSWLTKKGEWYRQTLAEVTHWEALTRAVDEAGYPECISVGCTNACWEVKPWTTTP